MNSPCKRNFELTHEALYVNHYFEMRTHENYTCHSISRSQTVGVIKLKKGTVRYVCIHAINLIFPNLLFKYSRSQNLPEKSRHYLFFNIFNFLIYGDCDIVKIKEVRCSSSE